MAVYVTAKSIWCSTRKSLQTFYCRVHMNKIFQTLYVCRHIKTQKVGLLNISHHNVTDHQNLPLWKPQKCIMVLTYHKYLLCIFYNFHNFGKVACRIKELVSNSLNDMEKGKKNMGTVNFLEQSKINNKTMGITLKR